LSDPIFTRLDTIRSVTDGQTHDDGIYRASIASRGKNGSHDATMFRDVLFSVGWD